MNNPSFVSWSQLGSRKENFMQEEEYIVTDCAGKFFKISVAISSLFLKLEIVGMFKNLNVSPLVVQAFAKRWRNHKLLNMPTDVRHVIQTKGTRWRNTHHAIGAISQPIFILQLTRCIYCAIHSVAMTSTHFLYCKLRAPHFVSEVNHYAIF
jgi:hypothetical protein